MMFFIVCSHFKSPSFNQYHSESHTINFNIFVNDIIHFQLRHHDCLASHKLHRLILHSAFYKNPTSVIYIHLHALIPLASRYYDIKQSSACRTNYLLRAVQYISRLCFYIRQNYFANYGIPRKLQT